ncbi:hypothetical protein R1sor_017424 [Riccia sorocarpa]|uniref:DUF659 domain-containing protein n=1 Tax=Riccia sorocarpa TaxID=122646 RepID=A0ABD3IAU5_9MARC
MDIDEGSSGRDGGDRENMLDDMEAVGRTDVGKRSHPKSALSKFVMSHFRTLEDGKIQCVFCDKSWKSNITRLCDHFLYANMNANMKKLGTRSWRGDSGRRQANSHIAGCEKCPDEVYKNILTMKRAREDRSTNLKVGEGVASQILASMHAVNVPGQPDWMRVHEDGSNHTSDLILEHDVILRLLRASQSVGRSLHQDHAADNANASQESMVRKASYRHASLPELNIWEMKQVKEATEDRMWDNTVGRRGTVSCDGWTNVRGHALLNIVVVSRNGEMLLKHVDGSNTRKDSQWVADNIIKEVLQIGPTNILQFTADNAHVNKLVGYLIRMRFPHIVFGGCVAHGLDLVCEDIGRLPWVKSIFDKCREFITFIKGHQRSHSMFLDYFSNGVELLKPGATRFATNIIMLDRAYGLSDSLRAMVLKKRHDEEYGAAGDVNEAWVPTERLNVPQQYTKDGKAIPPPFDWDEQIDEDEVKDNMKTSMGTSNIPSQVIHFDDLKDEDFDAPSDGIYDESVDMEDLNETLASCLTCREWKEDREGNEMKHVLTESMATKYRIDSEKANELNEKFPHRQVPRVVLNCPEIIMEEVKFKMLKDLYEMNMGSRPVQERKPVPKDKSRFATSSSQPSLKSCYD